MFEILLPLVFYLVCYCHEGFVKPFAGLIFIFLGSFHSYFACKIDSFPKRLLEPKWLLNGGSGSLKNPGAGAVWLRLYSPVKEIYSKSPAKIVYTGILVLLARLS